LHAGGLALNEITCQHYSPYYPIAKIQDLIGFDKIQTIGGETISILEHEAITLQVQAIIITSSSSNKILPDLARVEPSTNSPAACRSRISPRRSRHHQTHQKEEA
jgi:hypothetical protein